MKTIPASEAGIGDPPGAFIVEDIVMCEDMHTAWMIGIANSDLAQLYEYNLDTDSVTNVIELRVLDGPRGQRGIDVDVSCRWAFVTHYSINTVAVIALKDAPDGSYLKGDALAELPVAAKPTGIALTNPEGDCACVSNSFSDLVTIIYTNHERWVKDPSISVEIEVGFGPNGVVASGKQWCAVGNRYDDTVYVIPIEPDECTQKGDLLYTVEGLERVPNAVCATPDGKKLYAVDELAGGVNVIRVGSWAVTKFIETGHLPRYCAMSTDGNFLYVSNTIDKTVSVVKTSTDTVVETITIDPTEPAPIGALAITKDNRYLYVFWTGEKAGSLADFVLLKYDVGQLY